MAARSRQALDGRAVERALERMAAALLKAGGAGQELCLVGIRRGGVHLAERLRARLARDLGAAPPFGVLDISLYRDDSPKSGMQPVVGPTDIRFSLDDKVVVLVDDVLFTGRTVRAALDELMDFGRPRRVYLAVLVDRGGRELPISADFAGEQLSCQPKERVKVRLREDGSPEDEVVIEG